MGILLWNFRECSDVALLVYIVSVLHGGAPAVLHYNSQNGTRPSLGLQVRQVWACLVAQREIASRALRQVQVALLGSWLILCLGCGGNSYQSERVSPALPSTKQFVTGNPYFPLGSGTSRSYRITKIAAAHWDSAANELIIDSLNSEPNPLGETFTYYYSFRSDCTGVGPATFITKWSFSAKPRDFYWDSYIFDSVVTHTNGTRYIGEGVVNSGSLPEAKLTWDPIEGEHLDGTVEWKLDLSCNATETGGFIDWHYTTVRHLPELYGYQDVWQTTLIEQHVTIPRPPVYYTYFFAKNAGMIAFYCWTENPDFYSCGNLYTPH